MPQLTIITITYNAEAFLERTLRSIDRALKNISDTDFLEYIIIDGASEDTTLTIAQRYDHLITKLVSEPDQGLYDAMNKGLLLASGKYVWFLNAGDQVHDDTTFIKLLSALESDDDIYFSDTLLVRNDDSPIGLRSKVTPHSLTNTITWKDLRLGMKICHQSLLVRYAIAPKYDITNLSADLDWEISSFKNARRIKELDFVLCKYLIGGLSVQQHRRSLIDRFHVLRHHFGLIPTLWDHIQMFWRGYRFIRKHGKYW